MDRAHLGDVLRCHICGARYAIADDHVTCVNCSRRFPVVDGIPVLVADANPGTALDQFDYDRVMGINAEVIRQTGVEWNGIIAALGDQPETALEIGAGTGVLTQGLLEQESVGRLTATDVSISFLRALAPRLAQFSTPVSLVACDANEVHFREGAFDLVLGRSVLHHLLDYADTLRQCWSVLTPGGVALFYEPVLEGKTFTTFFMSLMLRVDEAAGDGDRLTDDERQQIRKQIRHQMQSTFLPQDRATLSKLEDKYIFKIDEMKQVGRDAGFVEVTFMNDPRSLGYWAYVAHTCQIVGVAPARIQRYQWIEDELRETYGAVFPERLATPVGYFVFRR
jgi:ubiquinone/menaquinone biosynthesis C-methylase UbiE/uncharacterized protein YbaR (Trm112 family)